MSEIFSLKKMEKESHQCKMLSIAAVILSFPAAIFAEVTNSFFILYSALGLIILSVGFAVIKIYYDIKYNLFKYFNPKIKKTKKRKR